MGSGSGIQAQTCRELDFKNILTADINPKAIKHLTPLNFKTIQTNLFEKIPKQKFNLIIFNPPYLPEDKREPEDSKLATTGGKEGYEIIIRFLEQAKNYLSDKGTILLIISSLSKPDIIKNKAEKLGYKTKSLDSQKLPFFEEIYVLEIQKNQ